jgi:hypothetical protein
LVWKKKEEKTKSTEKKIQQDEKKKPYHNWITPLVYLSIVKRRRQTGHTLGGKERKQVF